MSRVQASLALPLAASRAARALLLVLAVGSLSLAAASAGRADLFSPVSLVSYGAIGGGGFAQQAEYAHDSVVSADGRYVAFDGSIGGVTGVWRRDLGTEVIEQVAGGDASMPSISEDGRYVSFTTNEGGSLPEITHARANLVPHGEAVNVYRRDMDREPAPTAAEEAARPATERAFLAASVPAGSEEALRYSAPGASGGAYAAARSAMSANGSEVAFVTTAVSNLVPYPALEEEEAGRGEQPAPHTPAGQVAVHDFETGATELVSRCRFECGHGAASGAAEPVSAAEEAGKRIGAVATGAARFPEHGEDGSWPGASISADGSTVAWMGEDVGQQAPTLAQEHLEALYEEPLWRRLPAVANQTRRVTGGSDPEDPACAASGELALAIGSRNGGDPCQGPFLREAATPFSAGLIKDTISDDTPRLSANGEEVLFGANARLLAQGSDFDRGEETGNPTDLFIVNMRPGLTRSQALTHLTEAGNLETQGSAIGDYEISPDGEQVAFTTLRTVFTLGQPTLVSPALAEVGIAELYDANLADGTLTRVTHGYAAEAESSGQPHPAQRSQNGDPYGELKEVKPRDLGALTPSFSADGNELVFTSTAANLVYGDGNSPAYPLDCCQAGDGSDVFEVTRSPFVTEPTTQSISPAPVTAIEPEWRLGATAQLNANGTLALYVETPGTGRLQATARGDILLTRRSARGRKARIQRVLATATLATETAVQTAPAGGLMRVLVRVASRYSSLLERPQGLPASLRVSFASAGRPTLSQTLAVTFKRPPPITGKAAKRASTHRGLPSAARRASKRR